MTITCGIARREPCSKCGLPVFIAERLNVGKQLYHRTCFCCARCNSQLTLANYYETENNEFCCEMCPDEEPSVDLEKSVLNRSLSDEEKSAGLKKYEETDNYSAIFETALENPENETLMKKYTLSRELSDDFSAARSTFMQSQLSLNHSDSSDEEPPELPKNKPPDTIKSSENVCDDYQDVINSENSSFPHEKLVHSVSSDSDSNQHVTASTELERTNNFVTKETETNDDNEDSDKNSEDGAISVKSRILLFDNKSPEKKPVEKSELNKISNDEEPVIEEIKTVTEDTSCEDSKCDDPKSNEESVESVITISDESKNVDSPNVITDDSAQLVHSVIVEKPKRTQEYSKDLNPFGDDLSDDEEPVETNLKKSRSLNPFDEDDFEDEVVEKPKPALRKKVKAQMRYEEKTGDTPDHLEKTYVQRISENPFEKPENMPQPIPSIKKISAPKISLNPFWSDGEEPPDDEENEEKPTPLPRNAKTTAEKPEPKPRDLGLSVSNRSTFGSNASLSSTSFENVTIRKKKPAPKPPVSKESFQQLESPLSSLNASPNRSLPHSPKSTPKIRKNKKAPPPPQPPHQLSSTPFIKSNNEDDLKSFSDISPIGENWRNEKTAKDELNRNRQSQYSSSGISPTSSDSSSLSMQNKSTYGKWKRRKGPAPARPVPQRRIVKALSIMEIRRELDIIEIQQQGLEKQGVRLEQIIRERCEGPNANEDDSFSPEVEDMVLQLFDLVNEKNELFRKQAELMYLRRQHRLEEEHADVEYQIRCLMLKSETSKTDSDKAREEELINRLVEIVERRNEIIECLEMDRVREAEEDNSIKNQLNKYSLKRDIDKSTILKKLKKEKKKHKKEKRFKLKSGQKVDMDKDVDECETSSESPVKQQQEKKKKKFKIF